MNKPSKILPLVAIALGVALGAGAATVAPTKAPAATLLYNSIPTPLPGNIISQGFECCSAAEFGDHIQFGPGPRRAQWVDVAMSSWGCESGGWTTVCSTTPGATFDHDLTLNIYEVDRSGEVPALGQLIASVEQTFHIPYRPSADPVNCPGGRWYSASEAHCYNGLAVVLRFDIKRLRLDLPDEVVLGIAYNTTHHGYNPIGEAAACYHEDGGCGYDSLNVGADANNVGATVGVDPEPDTAFFNTTYAPFYCDFGAGGTGIFRRDSPCWGGYTPTFAVGVGGKVTGGGQLTGSVQRGIAPR